MVTQSKKVKEKQGGGTRKTKLDIHAGLNDILQEGNKLFFLDAKSPKGSESGFEFQLWDYLMTFACPLALCTRLRG